MQTLRAKILFYLLIVSMIGIVVVSIFIQWGFEESFNSYLDRNRDKKIERVIEEIKTNYKKTQNFSSDAVFQLLNEHALTEQLYFQLFDDFGQLHMDTSRIRGMLNGLGLPEQQQYEEEWKTSAYTLVVDNDTVGRLIAIYPEGLIDDEDIFLQTIQQYIYAAIALTILLSILFSMIFSKKLTSGLKKLLFAANELQQHNLGIRIPLSGLSTEVKQIAISFNDLAESLSKEERLRKQFTGDLAHELRTPLAILRSQIEAYQDGIWEPTPQRLQQSHEELMRLVRLVNELEKLLAAENPQIRLEKVDLEAGKVLFSLWEMFMPSFQQKRVSLDIQTPEKEAWFKGDKDRLMQILSNLLNNALKYTPEGKNVHLSILTGREDAVGFVIEDEGAGINEEDLPYIFERFYRGDKSRDRKTGGIGIGLSIVKALVEAHKGMVQVKSKVRKGTKISLWLPKE